MSFTQDFWTYCQSYEIPREHAIWCALGLLGAAVNRRIFIRRGDLLHHATMYVCLVAKQGNKKSTCNDWARDWFAEVYDDIPISSNIQSREDIIRFMASDDCTREYTDHLDTRVVYHPYMMFINEFGNFLSFNETGMISFLTDIYDRHKFFDSRTIIRGAERIPNPAVNIIACCPTDWLVRHLHGQIVTGGLCRRMVFVHADSARDDQGNLVSIPWPEVRPEATEAKLRAITHLHALKTFCGEAHLEPAARAHFDLWYHSNKQKGEKEGDPVIAAYLKSKDVQLLKVAMLLAAGQPEPSLTITRSLLTEALDITDCVEPNMAKLSIAAGRNPLAQPQAELIEFISAQGGMLPEKLVLHRMDINFSPMERLSSVRGLLDSGRLFKSEVPLADGRKRVMFLTPEKYQQLKQKNEASVKNEKHRTPPESSGQSLPSERPSGEGSADGKG